MDGLPAEMAGVLSGKMLGSLLILGSTTYVGWQVALGYARRPRQLRDLQTALAILQTEIEYGATPLPQALGAAARAADGMVGRIFSQTAQRLSEGRGLTPGDALRRSLAETAEETALQREDLEVLLALAPVLGGSGRSDQIRHLTLARERLSREEIRSREERDRYERVARSVGVLAGAALVLILW